MTYFLCCSFPKINFGEEASSLGLFAVLSGSGEVVTHALQVNTLRRLFPPPPQTSSCRWLYQALCSCGADSHHCTRPCSPPAQWLPRLVQAWQASEALPSCLEHPAGVYCQSTGQFCDSRWEAPTVSGPQLVPWPTRHPDFLHQGMGMSQVIGCNRGWCSQMAPALCTAASWALCPLGRCLCAALLLA